MYLCRDIVHPNCDDCVEPLKHIVKLNNFQALDAILPQYTRENLYSPDSNPRIFDVLNVDENGQERSPGQIEVTDTELILHQIAAGKDPIRWPLNSLRRYGFDAELFSFESGRRCPTGPGIYAFRCRRPEPLFNLLQECIIRAGEEERRAGNLSEGREGAGRDHHRIPVNGGTPTNRNQLRLHGRAEIAQRARRHDEITVGVVDDHSSHTHRMVNRRISNEIRHNSRLLLANWEGPEAHRLRLSAATAATSPPPNSLAALRRHIPASIQQQDYMNTDTEGLVTARQTLSSLTCREWSHDYENQMMPFKLASTASAGVDHIMWITSTLSSDDDVVENEACARHAVDDCAHANLQYADLDLLHRESLSNGGGTEGIPDEDGYEDDDAEDVFPLVDVKSNTIDEVAEVFKNDKVEERLVYVNVPTTSPTALMHPVVRLASEAGSGVEREAACSGGYDRRSATLPAISDTGVSHGNRETSSIADYANIGSIRKLGLSGVSPNGAASGSGRRATISNTVSAQQVVTQKLQPLSATVVTFQHVSHLPKPLTSSKLKPPLSPPFLSSTTLPSISPTAPLKVTSQKVTYVQLDLQTTPSTSVGSTSHVGSKNHPMVGFSNQSSLPSSLTCNGTDFPRFLNKSLALGTAMTTASSSSESYTMIDFERTLALNSKCVDEGIRKTRHNSHIEMVALN